MTTSHRSNQAAFVLLLTMALVFAISTPSRADPAPAPFDLGTLALMNRDGTTDFYLQVSAQDADARLPNQLDKVQVKSFDREGALRYTRNHTDVPAPAGLAALRLADVERHQPVQSFVHVRTAARSPELLLRQVAQVQLRPDLALINATAPARVTAGADFAVDAQVRELNGDLGASAAVTVSLGDRTFDQISGLQVAAGGQEAATFLVNLAEPGSYRLQIRITGSDPGDYDETNNAVEVAVDAVAPEPTRPFDPEPVVSASGPELTYQVRYHNFARTEDNLDGFAPDTDTPTRQTRKSGQWESAQLVLTQPASASGAVGVLSGSSAALTLRTETGHALALPLNLTPGWHLDPVSRISYQVSGADGTTRVAVYHYAGEWWRSERWGIVVITDRQSVGTYLGVQERLDIALTAADTASAGFKVDVLGPAGSAWDYWYDDRWTGWRWHAWGGQSWYTGAASGTVSGAGQGAP